MYCCPTNERKRNSMGMSSSEWAKLHPIRAKRHALAWAKRNRAPCKRCGGLMPYGIPGLLYCKACGPIVRASHSKKATKKRLRKLASFKLKRGCFRCGYAKCAAALHFHHKDPSEKVKRVLSHTDAERRKCVIVCANCHFELHERTKKLENGEVF